MTGDVVSGEAVTIAQASACGEALVHELIELLSAAGVLRAAIGHSKALHVAVPEWDLVDAKLQRDEQALLRAADHLEELVQQLQAAASPPRG